MEEPAYWECPACNCRAFTTEEDGRKKCCECERIWGTPLVRIIPDHETSNKKGNFIGKTGRTAKFMG